MTKSALLTIRNLIALVLVLVAARYCAEELEERGNSPAVADRAEWVEP